MIIRILKLKWREITPFKRGRDEILIQPCLCRFNNREEFLFGDGMFGAAEVADDLLIFALHLF